MASDNLLSRLSGGKIIELEIPPFSIFNFQFSIFNFQFSIFNLQSITTRAMRFGVQGIKARIASGKPLDRSSMILPRESPARFCFRRRSNCRCRWYESAPVAWRFATRRAEKKR